MTSDALCVRFGQRFVRYISTTLWSECGITQDRPFNELQNRIQRIKKKKSIKSDEVINSHSHEFCVVSATYFLKLG